MKQEVDWGSNRETCCICNKTHSNSTQHLNDKKGKVHKETLHFLCVWASVCMSIFQETYLKMGVRDYYNAPSEPGKDLILLSNIPVNIPNIYL